MADNGDRLLEQWRKQAVANLRVMNANSVREGAGAFGSAAPAARSEGRRAA